ncbi:MAG: flagellar basal-body rod protein FlgG [Planctomycetota bacterium]
MLNSLFTSATGMKAQQRYVDNISNNLANVNTTGFKASRIDFQDLLYHTLVAPGTETVQGYVSPTGLQIGTGVREVATTKIFRQGTPQNTGNQYDMAIEGHGFFQVTDPVTGETLYTRDGSFRPNAQGQLVTAGGYLLSPQITLPQGSMNVRVGNDGAVQVVASPGGTPQVVGQIQLVRFLNPAGLLNLGENLYAETAASGAPTTGVPDSTGFGRLLQHHLEGSNVDVVSEMVNLIIAQRAYEINSRGIRVSDSMLEQANNIAP